MIAIAITGSPIVVLIIGLGYILNSHQIVHNCYIGMTRVLVAMSLDRVLPEWFSKVNERYHTPVNAHLAYFLASLPVIWAYNKVRRLGRFDPGCHLRLRLRLHHHLPGWRAAALPRQGCL